MDLNKVTLMKSKKSKENFTWRWKFMSKNIENHKISWRIQIIIEEIHASEENQASHF